jgi:hypothetical protein
MSDFMQPSIKEQLWHKMRHDLAKFVPEISTNHLLMCCCCGRFLASEFFDLEHLIPQQALKADPLVVRSDPATPNNVRSGNLLLCKKSLIYKGSKLYGNGCNSWKGRFYDKPISDILGGRVPNLQSEDRHLRNAHIIGGLMLAYLAMVAEYGYIIALMPSGRLLREQFFNPHRFHRSLGTRYQVLLAGTPFTDAEVGIWSKPFSFAFNRGACLVTVRNFVITAPMSRDPFAPISQHIKITPSRFKLRPDFSTAFS